MNGGFQFFDLIFLAAVAGFLIFRLRNVLGRRGGYEQKPEDLLGAPQGEPAPVHPGFVPVPAPAEDAADAVAAGWARDHLAAEGLAAIAEADPGFSPDGFLKGARAAFEMIVTAFAEGRMEDIRPYLGPEVFAGFSAAVAARTQAGETAETQVISIKSGTVVSAEMEKTAARVAVEFVSEQVNLTRDAEGRIVGGDPNFVATLTDVWTFARDTRSSDPNWILTATRSV